MARTDHRQLLDARVLSRLSRLTIYARQPVIGSVTGVHRSATRGSSVEFAEYRKYVPGDDPRHLDWRVLARTDRLFIKEFEADTNLRCMIVLDTSGSMAYAGPAGSKFDFARRLAATLAYLLIQQGDAVGLTLVRPGGELEIPARRSPVHLGALLDTLVEANTGGEVNLTESLHRVAEKVRARALVVVVSDFFEEPERLLPAFQHMRFRRHDLALFHVLDRDEIRFPFDRPIRFVDLEGPDHIVTDPAIIGEAYRREVADYLNAIKRGALEFGADYRIAPVEDGYERALTAFMLQRQRAGGPGGGGARS